MLNSRDLYLVEPPHTKIVILVEIFRLRFFPDGYEEVWKPGRSRENEPDASPSLPKGLRVPKVSYHHLGSGDVGRSPRCYSLTAASVAHGERP
jgi:hypothetical protein